MVECAERLIRFVPASFEDFEQDLMAQDAACYLLIRLSEAAKDLPDDVRQAHPDIDWRGITGMRNRLAHQYLGINIRFVHTAARHDVLNLLDELDWSVRHDR